MIATQDIKIIRTDKSKLPTTSLENLPFGRTFTDHMLVAEYANGEWKNVEIRPYEPLSLDPACAALHYGQAIFEGIKAYKGNNDEMYVFRPQDNFKRFNNSARRMMMPEVPEEIFMDGMKALINLDKDWMPTMAEHSLYIRPFMFASDGMLGVKASDTYLFLIILSPTGPYYAAPMKIYVEEQYTRAAPGGVGFAKNAGNYGASLLPFSLAREKGYDQVLWTDAHEHKYLQEVGTMNVFFIVGDKAITPSLEEGTILAGVTRDSVITVLREMGIAVEERPLSIDELILFHKEGKFTEVFGTGTAATISYIKELRYKDYEMHFDIESLTVAKEVKRRLDAIRKCEVEDTHGWMYQL